MTDDYDRLDLRVQWTLGYVTGTVVTIAIVALVVILL